MEILEAQGTNGQIKVEGNLIHITRQGVSAFIQHGLDGTKTLFLPKLSGIQYKECGKMTSGFIQFIFSGSDESKKGALNATKDENTVFFDSKNQESFDNIREYILNKMQNS